MRRLDARPPPAGLLAQAARTAGFPRRSASWRAERRHFRERVRGASALRRSGLRAADSSAARVWFLARHLVVDHPESVAGAPSGGRGPQGLWLDGPAGGRLLAARASAACLGSFEKARHRPSGAGRALVGRFGGARDGAQLARADNPPGAVQRLGLRSAAWFCLSMVPNVGRRRSALWMVRLQLGAEHAFAWIPSAGPGDFADDQSSEVEDGPARRTGRRFGHLASDAFRRAGKSLPLLEPSRAGALGTARRDRRARVRPAVGGGSARRANRFSAMRPFPDDRGGRGLHRRAAKLLGHALATYQGCDSATA